MIDIKITQDVKEKLIKGASPVLLDQALSSALKRRLEELVFWIRESREEVMNIRGNSENYSVTEILEQKLRELIE